MPGINSSAYAWFVSVGLVLIILFRIDFIKNVIFVIKVYLQVNWLFGWTWKVWLLHVAGGGVLVVSSIYCPVLTGQIASIIGAAIIEYHRQAAFINANVNPLPLNPIIPPRIRFIQMNGFENARAAQRQLEFRHIAQEILNRELQADAVGRQVEVTNAGRLSLEDTNYALQPIAPEEGTLATVGEENLIPMPFWLGLDNIYM